MNFILNNFIIDIMRSNLFTTVALITVPSIVLSGIMFYNYIKDLKDPKDQKEDLQMENIVDTKLIEVLAQQNHQLDGLMLQLETIQDNLDNLRGKIERSSEVDHEAL